MYPCEPISGSPLLTCHQQSHSIYGIYCWRAGSRKVGGRLPAGIARQNGSETIISRSNWKNINMIITSKAKFCNSKHDVSIGVSEVLRRRLFSRSYCHEQYLYKHTCAGLSNSPKLPLSCLLSPVQGSSF